MGLFKNRKSPSTTTTTVVEIIDRKSKIDNARNDEKNNGQHKHYFSKREVAAPGIDPRCKVCGIHLSDLMLQRKLEATRERFRHARNRVKSEKTPPGN